MDQTTTNSALQCLVLQISAQDFTVSRAITSTATSVTTALGKQVCQNNKLYLGGNFYYAVSVNRTSVGTGTGKFFLWKIDDEGIVRDVATHTCPTSGSGLEQERRITLKIKKWH